ncbi:hypothetical protein [Pseudomonas sp. KCJK9016]|uniref:hypothetical protein n=1 Tax=Pseudomonas sp. KCJK9016 TaxID=3344556 RepID=UPI0039059FF5
MSVVLAGKFNKYAVDQNDRQHEFDLKERELIMIELKRLLQAPPAEAPIVWWDYQIELQEGSSLHKIHRPGQKLLSKLMDTVAMRSALTQNAIEQDALICVGADGKLEVWSDIGWLDFVQRGYFRHFTQGREVLPVIVDIARISGGYVWLDDAIAVDQWLRFHDFDVPKTVDQVKNLLAFFEFEFPMVDDLGNYWGQIVNDDPALFVLSSDQRKTIKNITRELIGDDERLLDSLFRKTRSDIALHDNAAAVIKKLLSHPISRKYAEKYVELQGWFGAERGQIMAPQQLEQSLLTVILLDINPLIGKVQGRKSVGSYEVYAREYLGRPPAIALEGLRAHMVSNRWASHDTAPLAIHLVLAAVAPEFLVRQVPGNVLIGSLEWVNFCRAVALVEAVVQGAARVMTYEQIMSFAQLEPVSQALADLHTVALIDPIVDWALMNGIVDPDELRNAEQASTQKALQAYQRFVEDFAQVSRAYAKPLPDRKNIALGALRQTAPDCDFLESPLLVQRPGLYASPAVMSMVDLHISGDLLKQEWDFRGVFPDSTAPDLLSGISGYRRPVLHDPAVMSIYSRYPEMLKMPANNVEFHRQLHVYLGEMNRALATTLKWSLARLSSFELQGILNGEITFFTLRKSAIITRTTPIGGPLVREEPVESQEGKDAATGRFGIVMCVLYRGRTSCYEVFTLRGEIHRNDELGKLIVNTGKLDSAARVDFSGDRRAHVPSTPEERLPINLQCYVEGVANDFRVTSSLAIIDKLATLARPLSESSPLRSEYRNYAAPQLARIAQLIVSHHPLMTFEQLEAAATRPTTLELEREKGERVATYIVDLAVPFKKCVQDLTSGEHNQVVDGIYGCAMDAIALVGTFAGAGTKVVSIVTRASRTSSALASLARLIVGTGVSIFNPLDDVPSIVRGTGKLVYRGGLRLSREAQQVLAVAKAQLGHLKGVPARRLGSPSNVVQGTWRPHPGSTDTLTVLAAREDFHWYALDRTGKAWGPKLSNFGFDSPFIAARFDKTLPLSYSRYVLQHSLSRVKTKVETAINALSGHDFTQERNFIIKMFLGDDSQDARDRVLKYLKLIKTDFDGFSLSNFILDAYKDVGHIAAFNREIYQQWIASGAEQRSNLAFIEIHIRGLNRHFIRHGYNHDVVADDLIHEMLHGAARTDDVCYAIDKAGDGATAQVLDVAPLLNLAIGRQAVMPEQASSRFHEATKTFENADSLAVATSLLSQLLTDKTGHDSNAATLAAVANQIDKAIDGPVLITLNKTA